MAHRTMTELSDLELEELAEAVVREQKAREDAALRALRNQRSMFLPARLYAGVR